MIPSLHVDYKKSRIKQYHKENQALRTETTINDTRDFGVGKSLKNLPALRRIGFQANRRLLGVQKITQDCVLGEAALRGQCVRLARSLAAERTARKPDSPLNRWLFARPGAMAAAS